MKKLFALLIMTSLLLMGCQDEGVKHESYTPSYSTANKKIGLVTDVGSIDDKSFNQTAWEGIVDYANSNDLSIETNYKYFQPSGGSNAGTQDYINAMNNAINWGAELIVCPGFLFGTAIYEIQEKHKNIGFILIDGVPNEGDYKDIYIAPNTVAILFKEQESGFLAGYGVVKDGYTNLGFMGGLAVPAVVRFGIGFIAGAYYAAKEDNITNLNISKDHYTYLGTFESSPNIKTRAEGWYNAGVDVIFAAAGGAGSSVMAAAQEGNNKWMVGVDKDQATDSPRVLTSAMKGVHSGTVLALESFYDQGFNIGGTTLNLGAEEEGVGLPLSSESWRFSTFTIEEYQAIYDQVKSSITVPDTHAALKTFVEDLGFSLNLSFDDIGM
jgi:basic membrane protein A